MKQTSLIPPVAIALETIVQTDGDLQVSGIDLDTGLRVSIRMKYEPTTCATKVAWNGLLLSLSLVEPPPFD